MTDSQAAEDNWDFYPCLVDDRPGSILVNLRYKSESPVPDADTLYWLRIGMLDPADHGMGSPAEAEVLQPLEDRLAEEATSVGFIYVGRLRNHGWWQLTFYGRANRDAALRALEHEVPDGRRTVEVGEMADPDWSYYNEFLFPDRERRQWMFDRRVVAVLEGQGDPLTTARRVDHWAYFRAAPARDAFLADAQRAGFESGGTRDDAPDPHPFGAQVFRTHGVELDEVHGVVMTLVELAEQHEGEYDGWETSVEAPSAPVP